MTLSTVWEGLTTRYIPDLPLGKLEHFQKVSTPDILEILSSMNRSSNPDYLFDAKIVNLDLIHDYSALPLQHFRKLG